jgi:putative SOS response-associated peptidase YedK
MFDPVIVAPENYDLWLDPGFTKVDDLHDLLSHSPPTPCATIV